ncbi:MAG: PqqD family protein [Candidatus Polarisedimenticolia bacterium]
MDLSIVLVKNPLAAYRIYEGKATVVLSERAEVKVVNEIGSLIWDRIDGRRTLGEIADQVVAEYDVDPEEARRDVLEFAASLSEHGMVA